MQHFMISNQFCSSLCPPQNHKNTPHSCQQRTSTAHLSPHFRILASSTSDKHGVAQQSMRNGKKSSRTSRRLITISTSCGRWQGEWSSDFLLSLRELQLSDLADEGDKNAAVLVSLSVQKHTGFGFSVDGRIITSFKRKCSCCFSSYCKEIDTTFDVWVLPSNKDNELRLPEIGESDQVIYVKPGSEADLDSVVQDTIRLIASIKDTCSESCEKSTFTWQYTDQQRSHDQRWSQLLQLKNSM